MWEDQRVYIPRRRARGHNHSATMTPLWISLLCLACAVALPHLVHGGPTFHANLREFPPGRPTEANIGNICRKTRAKVTYGANNLPQSGFSHLGRQGDAINSVETGYSRCCSQSDKLSCAVNVWENALDNFCMEESTIMTRQNHCCKKTGEQRKTCFSKDSPIPNYNG
ncbi:extracellular matrix protein 1-like [Rana temporaria]|uniref:extracellular matrix protein 1-like n=1 Tax=Rana temporaria TaxID=8407 RepID=UPI001AAC5FCF|nr:extracellular matrix protein 1-like [Rana temporaria]